MARSKPTSAASYARAHSTSCSQLAEETKRFSAQTRTGPPGELRSPRDCRSEAPRRRCGRHAGGRQWCGSKARGSGHHPALSACRASATRRAAHVADPRLDPSVDELVQHGGHLGGHGSAGAQLLRSGARDPTVERLMQVDGEDQEGQAPLVGPADGPMKEANPLHRLTPQTKPNDPSGQGTKGLHEDLPKVALTPLKESNHQTDRAPILKEPGVLACFTNENQVRINPLLGSASVEPHEAWLERPPQGVRVDST